MDLKEVLLRSAALSRAAPRTEQQIARTADWRYLSTAEFVAAEGRRFQSQPLTEDEMRALRSAIDVFRHVEGKFAVNQCYANSQILVQLDPTETFRYAEGYALDPLGPGIPFLHGWVVLNDKVIDLTGPPADPRNLPAEPPQLLGLFEPRVYLGVVFPTKQVFRRFGFGKGWGSLIDDWQNEWPLLRFGRTGRSRRQRPDRAPAR